MAKKEILLIVAITVLSSIHLSFAQQAPLRTTPAPKAAVQPLQTREVPKNLATIYSSDFEALVSQIFSGASLGVNSCGGADAVRASKINVPKVYQKQEQLSRLDFDLPDQVKQQTMREEISYSKNPPVIRDAKIRACMDNLKTYPWKGFIENGIFKIRLQFSSNLFVKTRKMEQKKTSSGWENNFDWNDNLADRNVPDYFYVAPCLDVYLVPVVQNGVLSYGNVAVNWLWHEDKGFVWPEGALVRDPFAIPYGHPTEKAMILNYKTDVMNILIQRVATAFNDSSIRDLMTAALTSKAKSGDFSNRTIVAVVSGKASYISVEFK